MEIHPYFSLNRTEFEVEFAGGPSIPTVARDPSPLIQPSDWVWEFDDKIYVDDLDAGFFVDQSSTNSDSRFTVRMISLNQTDPDLISRDHGLRVYDGYSNVSAAEWTRQEVDTSFGSYRRTLVRAEHDSTPEKVHFKATLPHAGNWDLLYYLPEIGAPNDNVFENRGQYGLDFGGGNTWGDFEITVTQRDLVNGAGFRGEEVESGWNRIGSFELHTGNVKVSVSTKSSRGTVIADAIYWELVGLAEI